MTNLTQHSNTPTRAYILAGGSGTRLWPVSRQSLPKQFVKLFADDTLLEATIKRLGTIIAPEQVTIVTAAAAAKGEPMVHLAPYRTLLEPVARNTAPAIAIAALDAMERDGDAVMVVLPSDHVIQDVVAYQARLREAIQLAIDGNLVTFGIVPTCPETGYGYIQCADAPVANGASTHAEHKWMHVSAFKEKPDRATAAQFLREGDYYWNSGMFVWRASAILRAITHCLPPLNEVVQRMQQAMREGASLQEAVNAHFANAPAISIDHGVLEKLSGAKTPNLASLPTLALVPADIGWSDIGSWDAVHDLKPKDAAGNAITGNVLAHAVKNVHIHAGKRLVAAVGVEDISIVDTPDALLVTKRGAAQDVRHIVGALDKRASVDANAREHIEHLTVHRPWGSYTVLEDAATHKVKRIVVKPGGRLSLQSHSHRAEHWVVVRGVATVTNGATVRDLKPNESTYIPIGEKHRLENQGAIDVELIEVQVGAYLGEDDIKRYDDQYGRV